MRLIVENELHRIMLYNKGLGRHYLQIRTHIGEILKNLPDKDQENTLIPIAVYEQIDLLKK